MQTQLVYTFHATVYARPESAAAGPTLQISTQQVTTLAFPRADLGRPFACTFEEVAARLQSLPRMDFELDGYFLWSGTEATTRWQVDGHLYDRHDRLLMVNLKGSCPATEFDQLLSAFGWPGIPLMFELVREALYVDEMQFRKLAMSTSN